MCYLSYFLKVNVKYLCGNVSYLEGCYVTYFVYDLLLFCRNMRRQQQGIFMAFQFNVQLISTHYKVQTVKIISLKKRSSMKFQIKK